MLSGNNMITGNKYKYFQVKTPFSCFREQEEASVLHVPVTDDDFTVVRGPPMD